jgi:hypothetical protein
LSLIALTATIASAGFSDQDRDTERGDWMPIQSAPSAPLGISDAIRCRTTVAKCESGRIASTRVDAFRATPAGTEVF